MRLRKIGKRIVSGMLAVMLAVSGVPLPTGESWGMETVYAETTEDGKYEYKILEDGTVEICAYCGDGTEVVVPSEIDGRNVTSIGDSAFRNCTSLTSIELPSGIISIGNWAFYICSRLTSIELPSGIISMGDLAFGYCSSLTSIELSGALTSIGDSVFSGCSSLTSIELPSGLTSIGGGTFYECTSLTSVELPGALTSIGNSVFSGCSSLTSIELPSGLTSIGESAFAGCTSLISIELPSGITSIADSSFYNCTSLTSIELPSGITSIADRAFYECTSLTSIEMPGALTSIGNYVFCGCTSLTSIELPSGITSIGDGMFSKCTSLTSIKMPVSITSIGDGMFSKCTSLTSIKMPVSITSIGNRTFYECTSLTSIELPSGITSIGDSTFYECTSLTSIEMPVSLTSIGESAFDGCTSLTSIELPAGLTSIGDLAFRSCKSLTSIELPSGITSISASVFEWCSNLTSIGLPDGLTSIGNRAFGGCTSLTSIELPSGLTSIEIRAFEGCSSLPSIELPVGITSISDYAFFGCTSLTSIELPRGITSIGEFAFCDCTSLTRIEFPNGLKKIMYGAFYKCSSLISMVIPNSVTSINADIFTHCDKVVIYSQRDSYAHRYALKNNISWQDIALTTETTVIPIDTNVDANTIVFHMFNRTAYAEASGLLTGSLHAELGNVTVQCSEKTMIVVENVVNLSYPAATSDNYAVFSKEGYQDYIIPAAVASTWKEKQLSNFNIYMTKDRKDGKPYISTVFAKEKNQTEYVDIQDQDITIMDNREYDIHMSAVGVGSGAVYYLGQDGSKKISSTTGIFKEIELYDIFQGNRKVYAYVKNADGTISELVEVNLQKIASDNPVVDVLNKSTFELIGKDGQKLTLPDDVPIIGGSEISVAGASVPVGVSIEGNKVKISLGLDIFSKKLNGDKKFEWGDFKEQCQLLNSGVKSAKEKKQYFDSFMNYAYGGFGKSYNEMNNTFGMNFFGYIEAQITEDALVVTDMSGTLAAEFVFSYTLQTVLGGIVPAYVYVEAGAEAGVSVSQARATGDRDVPFDLGIKLDVEPKLKIGAGIGVKGFASGGIYGQATLPFENDFSAQHRRLALRGELGLEYELLVLQGTVPLLNGELVICDEYYGKGTTESQVASVNEVSLISRDYLNTMSDWQTATLSLEAEENITVSDLQTSVYNNGQCKVINFSDNMMMVWVEDCAERDTYNRLRLMYSVYDGTEDTWSAAKAVYDDGTLDSAPVLATDGENVYVVWQDISKVLTAEDTESTSTLMSNAEIMMAKYNAKNDTFEHVTRLTENTTYDYAPTVSVDNGIATVYWVNSTSENFEAGQMSIWKQVEGKQAAAVYTELNYVPELACVDGVVAYNMDSDGDIATVDDVYIFTNGVKVKDQPEAESKLNFTYGVINGTETLFYADNSNLYYIKDGVSKPIFKEVRSINNNLKVINNGDRTRVIWSELTEAGSEFYTCEYADGKWSIPVQLSDMGALLSNLDATYYNNMVVGVFNRTARTPALDAEGNTYYENGMTDMCQFTTTGFHDIAISVPYIDESEFVKGEDTTISVVVENLGTEMVKEIQFELTDTLGTSNTIVKSVSLASGEQAIIDLVYTVPENYGTTTLTVHATIPETEDEITGNNTLIQEMGYYDLKMGECSVEKVGATYVISGIVSNESPIDATDMTVDIRVGSEDAEILSSAEVERIAAGEKYYIKVVLNASNVKQNLIDDVCKVYFQAKAAGTESMTENNYAVASVAKKGETQTTSIEEVVINLSETSFQYDGSEKKPKITVTDGEITLENNVDYTVSYSNNINAGTATVTINGIGNYAGTETRTFEIVLPVEETTSQEETTETEDKTTSEIPESSSQEETTKVEELTSEQQETSSREDMTTKPTEETTSVQEEMTTEPVEETTSVQEEMTTEPTEESTTSQEESTTEKPEETTTGQEESTTEKPEETTTGQEETTTKPEQVKQRLTNLSIAVSSYTYDGYAKKPTPTVKCGTKKLTKDKDYKATYKNNVNPGTATVTVTGIGTYTGTLTKTFKISLSKVTSLKQNTSYTTSNITMAWNKVKGATGYEIYRAASKNSSYKLLKTVTANSYTQSGLKAAVKYYYKVRAYRTVNGKKVYGAYSEAKSMITKPAAPTMKLTAGSKRVKVSWTKSSGSNGYEVYMATSRNGSYTKIKSANSLQFHYTKTGLTKGKTYYFKVRAFKKTGVGVKVYSGYSRVSAVKVK